MNQKLFLTLEVILASGLGALAQTTGRPAPPPPAPSVSVAPSQPVITTTTPNVVVPAQNSTINGLTPNAVSGFAPNPVNGFAPNAVNGLTSQPQGSLATNIQVAPNTGAHVLTPSIGGAPVNNRIQTTANPNVIIVPQSRLQPNGQVRPNH